MESVHLLDYPELDDYKENKDLVDSMDKVRAICSSALFLRDKHNLRVRLPLNKIEIIGDKLEGINEFKDIILDEINVKNIEFNNNINNKAELKLELNFQKLGAIFGSKMQAIIKASKINDWKILENKKLKIADVELEEEFFKLKLVPKNLENTAVVEGYNILVELDTKIDKKLELEGFARDIIRTIQQSRKDANLDVADKINLFITTDDIILNEAINSFCEYIMEQTLSKSLKLESKKTKFSFDTKINDSNINISFDIN